MKTPAQDAESKKALEALDRLVEKIPFDPDYAAVPRAVGSEQSFKDYMMVKAALTTPAPQSEKMGWIVDVLEALNRGGFHATARGHIEDAVFINKAISILTKESPNNEQ